MLVDQHGLEVRQNLLIKVVFFKDGLGVGFVGGILAALRTLASVLLPKVLLLLLPNDPTSVLIYMS